MANTSAADSVTTPASLAELAWSIGSPPLLTDALLPHRSFSTLACEQLWQQCQHNVEELPSLSSRLGRRFESLWQFGLRGHPRWQLLNAGLLAKQGQQTFGEFDLLVRDRQSGETEHWELAVKFYLGDGDLTDPANWWGLHRRDRLDRKLDKLHQQLRLAQTSTGQQTLRQAGIVVDATRAVVKGRLFYPLQQSGRCAPFAAPDHLRGYWASAEQWQVWLKQRGDCDCWPLPRAHWLSGFHVMHYRPPEPVDVPAAIAFSAALAQASAFDAFGLANGEVALLVPTDWSTSAAISPVR